MPKASAATVTQARILCESLRGLPADDAARALEQIATIALAVQAEVLAQAQRVGELKDCGCRSVRGYAATIPRRSAGDASMVGQVALHLDDFPKLAEVYRDGRANTGNLRAVVDAVSSCGLGVLQAHEPALVDLATRAGPAEIKEFCQVLADINHPDRDEQKIRAQSGRMVRLARVGDLMHLDAMVDPVLGAQLKATLTAMAEQTAAEQRREERQRQLTDDATRGHGTGLGGPVPFTERCADALEGVLRKGMDVADLPAQARRRPHAVIHADLGTVLRLPGHGQALLERFGLVPAGTAAGITCDALVQVVLGYGDKVLNVGHTIRTVSTAQRTALGATYRTCVVPGCRVPFTDCAIHHLWWWSLLGPTDLDLQVPLCGLHHRRLHDGDFSISREHGHLVFRDPHGRTIANIRDVLAEQLDLLHQRRPPYDGPTTDADRTVHEVIRQATATGSRPGSRYQHGIWGWNGHNPGPPPGHAPPQAS